MSLKLHSLAATVGGLALAFQSIPALAQPARTATAATYADIADLADSAGLVIHAQIRKMIRLDEERARDVKPGTARFYMEADTKALLTGKAPLGESVAYLVDVPLDDRGRAPKLKKQHVLLFARGVPGRAGEIQLVSPNAQLLWNEETDARVRSIVKALLAPDAPAGVTGVRELLHVPGTLAGQGETQIFLNTEDGSAASLTVRHQPGSPPAWGASFSELVADVGRPPQPETLEWYRLACFLPANPPQNANISETFASRRQAEADYRLVVEQLGECKRSLGNEGEPKPAV